jgi:hypothetical protein
MADHARKQLRDAVADAVTGLASTGSRVFVSRLVPTRAEETLPLLLVYTTSESSEESTLDGIDERTIEVRVEGLAAATASLDDVLDEIAKEVEIALGTPIAIGSDETRLSYTGAEIEMRDGLARPVGSVALSFEAVLFTASGSPDVITGA